MLPRIALIAVILLLAAFTHGRVSTVTTVVTNGDNVPIVVYPTGPSAFRDVSGTTTWLTWSGTVGGVRKIQVATKPDASSWSAPVTIATNPNNDDHGQPAFVMDQYGFVHLFCCSHISAFSYTYTTTARSAAAWAALTQPTSGAFTFYAPVLVNGEIYLLTTNTASSEQTIWVQHGTPQVTGGVASWTGGAFITSLAGNGSTWISDPIVNGALICFVWTWQNGSGNASMQNGYYGCYNTADGSFQNVNASTIVAAGSLPINTTTAAANFLVFSSGGGSKATILPAQIIDAGGTIHVIYADSAYNVPPNPLLETHWNGSAWTSGAAVGGSVYNINVSVAGVASAVDGFDLYWPSATNTMNTVHWSSSGGFGTVATCFISSSSYSVFEAQRIPNGLSTLNMLAILAGNLSFNGHIYGDVPVYAFGTGC